MNLHQKEFIEVKFTQRDRDLFNAGGSAPRRLRFGVSPSTLPCLVSPSLHRPSPSHLSRGCFGKNVLKAKELGTLRAEGAPAPRARPPSRAFLALLPSARPPGTSRAPFLPHDAPCLPLNVFYSVDLTSIPPHTPKSWGPSRSPACPPYSPPLSHLSHAQVSGPYRCPPRSAVSHLSTHLSTRPPVHPPRPTFPNFVVPAQGSGGAL